LRRRGAAVLFVHHAGRNGQARGTSKREDLLDVVLQLKRPANYDARDGAHFVLNFTKARHLQGDEAQSLEMKLSVHDGRAEWDIKTAEESTFDRVVEMTKDGLKPGEIADELGVNKSTVSRHMNHAKAMGLLRGVS
jgi:putative DNA primase/helicase